MAMQNAQRASTPRNLHEGQFEVFRPTVQVRRPKTYIWTRKDWNWHSPLAAPASGPLSDMSAAMFEPRLPTDAKKIRRLIGEKKWDENMYVARTKRMAAIERDELIRSVMTRALVCAAVRPASSTPYWLAEGNLSTTEVSSASMAMGQTVGSIERREEQIVRL